MHTVMWTFRLAGTPDGDQLVDTIRASAPMYYGVPGLIRKYYCLALERREAVGIYLWRSREDAERFYTPQWRDVVTARWGAAPARQDWDTPVVVESGESKLVVDG